MPPPDDRTPGLANALFGPRLGRPVFVAARTSTPLPMSVTDPATNFPGSCRGLPKWQQRPSIAGEAGAGADAWPPRRGGSAGAVDEAAPGQLFDFGFLER